MSRFMQGARSLAAVAIMALATWAPAQWTSVGTLAIPNYNYSFLASTPSGDLLAATHNSKGTGVAEELPALLIRNPQSGTPEVIPLSTISFEPSRGYGGIACDQSGSYFVSGDTGNATTSFVRKFKPDGSPDVTWAKQGELKPGRRCLGMDVLGDTLLLAVDWGVIQLYSVSTGAPLGELPKVKNLFVRDITIDPRSMRVFGIAQGGVVTWGEGTPWRPALYKMREISPAISEPRAGEGISIDPMNRSLLSTPIPGNVLVETRGNGSTTRTIIETAQSDTHLGDSVLSFDGARLYVSDMRGQKIHVLQRAVADNRVSSAIPFATLAPETAAGPAAGPPQWQRSYEATLSKAQAEGRPMLVYFRRGNVKACAEFEANILKTDNFYRRAAPYICVFEDVAANRLIASRLGIYRVPHVLVIGRDGKTVAEFSYNINPAELFKAMESVK